MRRVVAHAGIRDSNDLEVEIELCLVRRGELSLLERSSVTDSMVRKPPAFSNRPVPPTTLNSAGSGDNAAFTSGATVATISVWAKGDATPGSCVFHLSALYQTN